MDNENNIIPDSGKDINITFDREENYTYTTTFTTYINIETPSNKTYSFSLHMDYRLPNNNNSGHNQNNNGKRYITIYKSRTFISVEQILL